MNPAIQNTFMILRFEAYEQDNNFTKEQRDELVSIIDAVSDLELPILKPWKFAKNLNKIEKALNEYDLLFRTPGGNTRRIAFM